ncbi:site-specific integrase [Massilia sp. S19_KUP03_FR1]|uniref:site-specific integrase n=1 Tax=Massilia sp. S19_KUP03_FR1 TaxID=3025503 RepID=UPI002FCD8481
MATIKSRPNGTFQLRVKHRLLPRTIWATFDNRDDAVRYGAQLEGLLAQGIVPAALLDVKPRQAEVWTVGRCMLEYMRHNAVPVSDIKLLDTMRPDVAGMTTSALNYDWADAWICTMKRTDHLAPSTIRHRHGALARCFDWMLRKHPEIMAQNPLRLLKRGFATYTDLDAAVLAREGKEPRIDNERDRRVTGEEEAAIVSSLARRPNERVFFTLALETAMRMRECYTLQLSQVNLAKRTIHLERSKNGDSRQVPLTSTALALLRDFIETNKEAIFARGGRLFPFWDGNQDVRALDKTSAELSCVFREIFADAGMTGLTFHDTRHEATCRLYELTTLSDVLIAKITGHRDPRMLRRYASLRGSDLASRLW